ncbi:MAG: YopX family protein [bacterium]|jgi:uncharacterized phage protein (TIGR01671 family)
MNREMKFRVWDKEDKKYVSPSHIAINGNGILLITNSGMYLDFKNEHYAHLSQKYIVQQWTGCYDKNHTPIYEGDIVKVYSEEFENENFTGKVIFDEGSFLTWINKNDIRSVWSGDDIEVIGNIMENPELLKA